LRRKEQIDSIAYFDAKGEVGEEADEGVQSGGRTQFQGDIRSDGGVGAPSRSY